MRLNRPTEDDEALTRTLREWKVDATLPPRFQEQVWQRIARAETYQQSSRWRTLMHWIESAFQRPAWAVACVAVLFFAGLTSGYWQAEDRSAQMDSQWRTLYVNSVDPYQAPRN